VVFLLINSLFLWLFDGDFNLLNSGYAGIDGLFIIAPWVFMFLIPAITMRMFSDEKKGGTMELLLTRPLTDTQIILAKFIAGFILVLFALLPTLVYFYSIYQLGSPVGNMDVGGTVGSYIGLLLLGGSYVAIGLFASSLTDNQIVSFILAMFISFFLFMGIDSLASFSLLGSAEYTVKQIGISAHYNSLSRGVIDSRDVVYFGSLMALFIAMTRLVIQSRKW
jgi:ABC-2 type transport system permease protein